MLAAELVWTTTPVQQRAPRVVGRRGCRRPRVAGDPVRRPAIPDLIDETPKRTTERRQLEPLPSQLACHVETLDWVENTEVGMRGEGDVFFGEIS